MKAIYFLLILLFGLSATAQKTQIHYLSGTGADHTVEWDFFCSAGMNSQQWTTIPVPSCWEQQGFGAYNYGHVPFDKRLKETGRYKHQFFAPTDWKDSEIQLVFEGVMTDAEVKINGKQAGPTHQGAFYQFSYTVSDLIQFGQNNELEVLVKKHSDNASINHAERKADYWVFGGIFRPVFLAIKPKTNIQRVAVDAKANGQIKADVYLKNHLKAHSLQLEIADMSGVRLSSFEQTELNEETRIEGTVHGTHPWSPEFPMLYQATFKLIDKQGKLIHQHTERIGFRTIEVRANDGIYVNGVRTKLQGVNRHTFHPRYGRTSSKAISIEAVNLMKDMNMNAVRMSHYPPDSHFLDVCDSLGLYVLDELSGWQTPSYDDEIGRKLVEELIVRDVNHPSIIFWDNGNEGGENNTLNDDFGEIDIQQREVLHPWQDYKKTNTVHYIDYSYLVNDGFSQRKIFFPTEFLHGLYDGGLGAGLEDYWQRMWNDPLCAGGFLWVFADEAIERTDRNNQLDTDGNHAPDGILGPYHEKEGSFYTIKTIWSPIQFEKKYITPDFNGQLTVENRYQFTNLNQCRFEVEWLDFSGPDEQVKNKAIVRQQTHCEAKPETKTIVELAPQNDWQNFDAFRIRAYDPYQRLINQWTWPIKTAKAKAQELLISETNTSPQLTEGNGQIIVKANQTTYIFSKVNGTIQRVLKDGTTIPLSNGPIFVSQEKRVSKVSHHSNQEQCSIRVEFENSDYFQWIIGQDGRLNLEVAYQPVNNCSYAGITFDYPEKEVTGLKWLGNGPYRVYKNRMKGPDFGVWEKAYNNSITGYSDYIYPEFKGYHSSLYWAKLIGKKAPGFTVYAHSNDLFLRVLTPDTPKGPAKTQLTYPPGDISFLHGINAIGTKFKDAENLGPQSQPYFFNSKKIHGGKLMMNLTFEF
ncbi:glycoside hydrolase family 2 TIM barrel-domain containing protein [Sunxiuqinia elliptica]|uniref:beta-galactosidase n=1 Tax=Sunxiuqinia elliptica TaxID=655355 RepID=A0A1I2JV73_9BACT|nr:glycoside hydrolase family 2 TIM barrel-domain containing protein [Sunxiuqinia elliptica]SFF56726.1 Beta-galactosidase/beta-glucuronidase [Sunxiuqinia elliptica]